ncbi:conserved hypothetical protein (plasmid) [Gloeothece citriformis PCC 7424]|uniref:Uncharacterized protein n=1 Tax=Gloeothece citriformis (strain PCC 7424) TaxID=65393 RepID=B7KMD3_GLOC7|nr:hypothetical protein [Gloeothece citriformis]ACK73955.1 conserved hypothetical protein [Gloeothece citriformis PCC 7424]
MKAETFRVEHLFYTKGKTVLVFYTAGKCYQFRILHENGAVECGQCIFYTADGALNAARKSLNGEL